MVKHIRKIVLRKIAILCVITLIFLIGVYLSSATNRAHIHHELTLQALQRVLSGQYFFDAYESIEVESLVKLSREDLLLVDPEIAYRDYYLAKVGERLLLIKGSHNQFERLLNSEAIAQYNLEGEQIGIERLSDIVIDFKGAMIPLSKSAPFDRRLMQALHSQTLSDLNLDTIIYTEEAGRIPRIVLLVMLITITALLLLGYFLFFLIAPMQHRSFQLIKRRGIDGKTLIDQIEHEIPKESIHTKRASLLIFNEYAIIFSLFNMKVILFDRLIQLFSIRGGRLMTYYEVGYSDFIRLPKVLSATLMEYLQQNHPYLLLESTANDDLLAQTRVPDRQGIEKRVLLRKKAYYNGLPLDYYITEEKTSVREALSDEERLAIQRAYDQRIDL